MKHINFSPPADCGEIVEVEGIHGCLDSNDTTWLSLYDAARGLAITRFKNNTDSVVWERVRLYLRDFCYPPKTCRKDDNSDEGIFQPKLGKTDFIPVHIFFRLADKIHNHFATAFKEKVSRLIDSNAFAPIKPRHVAALQLFEHEQFGKIRALFIDDEPWFVGKDVAIALEYKDHKNALKLHVDAEDKMGWQITTPSRGVQQATIINEGGLYSLAVRSNMPKAKEFTRWLTHDVAISIRKHGFYVADNLKVEQETKPAPVKSIKFSKSRVRLLLDVADRADNPLKEQILREAANIIVGKNIF